MKPLAKQYARDEIKGPNRLGKMVCHSCNKSRICVESELGNAICEACLVIKYEFMLADR